VVYGVYFTDANTGYVSCFSGEVSKTTDGGASWTALTTGTSALLDDISFTDANTGYISGESGTILKTTNAGATWAPLSSGAGSNRLLGIHFLNANIGYASGGLVGGSNAGSIFKTSNGGATWTLDASNASRFYNGSFPSFGAGYVCGLNGTVVKVSNIVSVEENQSGISFELYPNPSSNTFYTNVILREAAIVSIKIYDVQGKELIVTNAEQLSAGEHKINLNNVPLPAGIYVMEIQAGDYTASKKFIRTE
jgi:photosystem II stability/assembly factor-like uncharacterized protein